MDKFFRAKKPISKRSQGTKKRDVPQPSGAALTSAVRREVHQSKQQVEAPAPPPAPNPLPAPIFRDWDDVLAQDVSAVDVSKMSNAEKEDVLRLFDVNPRYGPFSGVDRLMRWERALTWGLNPPEIIRRVIEGGNESKHQGGALL